MFVQQIEVWLTEEDKEKEISFPGILINEHLVICEKANGEAFVPKEVWDYFVYPGVSIKAR